MNIRKRRQRPVEKHHRCIGVWRTHLAVPHPSRTRPAGVPQLSRSTANQVAGRPRRCAVVGEARFMPMTKAEIRALRRDVKEGSDRSPLFWWLVEHSDEFLREGATERIAWEKHCARFARLGVSDAAGKAPTPATARKRGGGSASSWRLTLHGQIRRPPTHRRNYRRGNRQSSRPTNRPRRLTNLTW